MPTSLLATHYTLGTFQIDFDPPEEFLFTENETNERCVFNTGTGDGYFKDAFHDYVVHGAKQAVNPANIGTKAAGLYRLNLAPGANATVRMRMRPTASSGSDAFADFDAGFY